jgi:hypothetical protein
LAAKRHHYVPKFLLKRFSCDPGAENPAIWRLDTATGTCSRSSIVNETVISHYYGLEGTSHVSPTFLEETLAGIEAKAAAVIERLVAGQTPYPRERLTLAVFVWLQWQRTPLGRAWVSFALDQAARSVALRALLKRDEILQSRRKRGDPRSDEEIDDVRQKAIDYIDQGTLRATFSRDSKVLGIFLGTDKRLRRLPVACLGSGFGR